MKLILDATALRLYPVAKPGFSGGTERMVRELAAGLAAHHTVHVVAPDLDAEEQRGPREWWWGPDNHPTRADAVVMVHSLANVGAYSADHLLFATNGIDPDLGPGGQWADAVDAFPVFSQAHADLLCQMRPTVDRARCYVTGLGVRQGTLRTPRTKDRLLYANNPANGLWHVLDIFERIQQQRPDATLHIAYDFDRQFAARQWEASALAEALWACKRRIDANSAITNLGALNEAELQREMAEASLHVMPQDSENPSTTIWGLTQMECASLGVPLLLSDQAGYREVFGDGATLLPLPGTYLPHLERRCDAQDWADVATELLREPPKWQAASQQARALAQRHTWAAVIDRWNGLLATLAHREDQAA